MLRELGDLRLYAQAAVAAMVRSARSAAVASVLQLHVESGPNRGWRRSPWTVWLTFVLLAVLVFCPADNNYAPPAQLKNLLLISLDTLRADRLALYGGPVHTPNIESLASRGVVYERAYSHAPMTGPSHSSLFTSHLPSEHGVLNNGQNLDEAYPTLASLLRQSGRKTGAIVSLAALAKKYGYDRGFDNYQEGEARRSWWRTADEINGDALPYLKREWDSGQPNFTFLHYSDPHEPYLPPSRYQSLRVTKDTRTLATSVVDGRLIYFSSKVDQEQVEFELHLEGPHQLRTERWKWTPGVRLELIARNGRRVNLGTSGKSLSKHWVVPGRAAKVIMQLPSGKRPRSVYFRFHGLIEQPRSIWRSGYDEEIEFLDQQLGKLLALLDARQAWKDTAVVLTADHGEELGEREHFFGHVQTLSDALIRVPLIVVAPGYFRPGSRVAKLVRQIDLLPTLSQMMGFKLPNEARGLSLWPSSQLDERTAWAETHRTQAKSNRYAVVSAGAKVVFLPDAKQFEWRAIEDGKEAVVSEDKLARSTAERLRREVKTFAAMRLEKAIGNRMKLSDADKEALKALGYGE